MAKTGNQANCRSTVETDDGVLTHNAIFLNHKEAGTNVKASHRQVEMIIPNEVRDTGKDKYQCHMISPLLLSC